MFIKNITDSILLFLLSSILLLIVIYFIHSALVNVHIIAGQANLHIIPGNFIRVSLLCAKK